MNGRWQIKKRLFVHGVWKMAIFAAENINRKP
jgi:hypothetical protein